MNTDPHPNLLKRLTRNSLASTSQIPMGYGTWDQKKASDDMKVALTTMITNASPRGDAHRKTPVLGLLGPIGQGKTRIGCRILQMAVDQGRTSRYTTLEGFLWANRGNNMPGDEVHSQYFDPRYLVVDNAAIEGLSSWEKRLFVHLVDERAAAGGVTILVLNGTWEVAQLLPPAMLSTITEMTTIGKVGRK